MEFKGYYKIMYLLGVYDDITPDMMIIVTESVFMPTK